MNSLSSLEQQKFWWPTKPHSALELQCSLNTNRWGAGVIVRPQNAPVSPSTRALQCLRHAQVHTNAHTYTFTSTHVPIMYDSTEKNNFLMASESEVNKADSLLCRCPPWNRQVNAKGRSWQGGKRGAPQTCPEHGIATQGRNWSPGKVSQQACGNISGPAIRPQLSGDVSPEVHLGTSTVMVTVVPANGPDHTGHRTAGGARHLLCCNHRCDGDSEEGPGAGGCNVIAAHLGESLGISKHRLLKGKSSPRKISKLRF